MLSGGDNSKWRVYVVGFVGLLVLGTVLVWNAPSFSSLTAGGNEFILKRYNCPAGTYAVSVDKTGCKCKICESGYKCAGGATTGGGKKPCPPGSFQVMKGQEKCKKCTYGSYQNNPASIKCRKCPMGTKCPVPGLKKPVRCPTNAYQFSSGQTCCIPCEPGFVGGANGAKCVKQNMSPCTRNPKGGGVVYVKGKVVGCNGPFAGGVFGSQAQQLCNKKSGWSVCKNVGQVRVLGLSKAVCFNKTPLKKFYATQQQSTGGVCNNKGFNDVWGCGKGLPFLHNTNAGCSPFPYFTGSWGKFGGTKWSCPNCAAGRNPYVEAKLIRHAGGQGGVLCCKK